MTVKSVENIQIRKAVPEDAPLLHVLGSTTFYEAYFEQDDPHDIAGYIAASFAVDSIKEQIAEPDSTFFILFLNGLAVGYARLLAGSREPCIAAARTIELKRIYVVERVWGKGLGKVLLSHCVEEARRQKMDSIWLGVWQQNARALPFYLKNGFEKVGRLEYPYGNSVGINDVMELKLTAAHSL